MRTSAKVVAAVPLLVVALLAASLTVTPTSCIAPVSSQSSYAALSSNSFYQNTLSLIRTYQATYPQYTVENVVIPFDTSGLTAAANVLSASITLTPTAIANNMTCAVISDWYTDTYNYTAWVKDASSGYETAFGAQLLSSWTVNTAVTIPLLNPNAHINKTGTTYLRFNLRCSSAVPTSINQVNFSTSPYPSMAITYSTGGARMTTIVDSN
jgi:hypothetical protein